MDSNNLFTHFKSHFLLKPGSNITLVVVFAIILVLIFSYFPPHSQHITTEQPISISQSVLQAIYDQNRDKPLEYAESKPTIINSMERYLHQFDLYMQSHPEKAKAPLSIIRRRLYYLKNKGLDVSEAEKILNNHLEKYFVQNQTIKK